MFISVKIPVDKIKAVADVTKTALDGYREIDKTIAELPVVSKEMDGQRAVDAREAKLALFAAQKTQLLEDAKAKIEPLIADYQADIDEQTTPSGDLIQKNSDFLLFERGFIKSPDQLSRLIEKHLNTEHGLIFAMIAEGYAKARSWGADFDVLTDEGAVRDFGDEVIKICRKALEFPGGYFDTYVSDESFLDKVAAAFGVLGSFAASAYGEIEEPAEDDSSGSKESV